MKTSRLFIWLTIIFATSAYSVAQVADDKRSDPVGCANADRLETARCVLRDLSRGGRVRLIFVRYDEGERVAVPENLSEKLAKTPGPNH